MPYSYPNNIPERIKGLPKKAQEIWIGAFNGAYKQYNGNEEKSNATAWAQVKKSGYAKKDGKWSKMESSDKEEAKYAEYQGKKVNLDTPFRTPDGPKKFAVYVRNPKSGNVVKVTFGDPNMEIRRDNPKARKNFLARHNCDEKTAKTMAGYWSCKYSWGKKPVSKMEEGVTTAGKIDPEGKTSDVIFAGKSSDKKKKKKKVDYMKDESKMAVWDTKYVNSLSNSSFAYIDKEGKRHLPYKNKEGKVDLSHVRNALARLNQVKGMPGDKMASVKKMLENILGKSKKEESKMEESKFSQDNVSKLSSIVKVLKKLAKGKKPAERVELETEKVVALIDDLEGIVAQEKVEEAAKKEAESEKGDKSDEKDKKEEESTKKEEDDGNEEGENKDENDEKKDDKDDGEGDSEKESESEDKESEDDETKEKTSKNKVAKSKFAGEDDNSSDNEESEESKDNDEEDSGDKKKEEDDEEESSEDSDEEKESKFKEAIELCDKYQAELRKANELVSKFQKENIELKKQVEARDKQVSKFKQDIYTKKLKEVVQKISKFKRLSKEEELALEKKLLESKTSEVALEEMGNLIGDKMVSGADTSVLPSDLLHDVRYSEQPKAVSKMSNNDLLDVLSQVNARAHGYQP